MNIKDRTWVRLVTAVIIIALLSPDILCAGQKGQGDYLAAESRLSPFFEKHGLGIHNIGKIAMATARLRKLVFREIKGDISSEIEDLNGFLSDKNIEIEGGINEYTFRCTGKKVKYVVFNFRERGIRINALFIKDYRGLTKTECREIGIEDEDMHHLECPGLEEVWFIEARKMDSIPSISHASFMETGRADRVEIPKMGKRESLEGIDGNIAKVRNLYSGDIQDVVLTDKGEVDISGLIRKIRRLRISQQSKGAIVGIINLLKRTKVRFCTYDKLVGDLFGFSSADKKMIALHESLADDPVALFHEIGHYLISTGKMELGIMNDELRIGIGGQQYKIKLDTKPLVIANKNRNDPHYLLRALQRQVFGEKDSALTGKIKDRQEQDAKEFILRVRGTVRHSPLEYFVEKYGYLACAQAYRAAGGFAKYLFQPGISGVLALRSIINSREDLLRIVNDLVRLGRAVGDEAGRWRLFEDGIAVLYGHLTEHELKAYWPGLVKLGIAAEGGAWQVFTSIPVLKEISGNKLMDCWPVLVQLGIAVGGNVGYLFEYAIPSLRHLITNKEDLVNIGGDLARLDKAAGVNAGYLFASGIPSLKHLINSREDLRNIGDDLVKLGKAAGVKAENLFRFGIPALKETFGDELKDYWPGLVKLGIAAGDSNEDLFYSGIPALKKTFGYKFKDYWPGLVELGIAAGNDAGNLFRHGLKRFFSYEFKDYWPVLVRLGIAVGKNLALLFRVFLSIDDVSVLRQTFGDELLGLLSADLDEAIREVSSGKMDIRNKLHILANYIDLLRKVSQSGIKRPISFSDFYEILMGSKKGESKEITGEHRIHIRGLVYEAYVMREKILEMQRRALSLGRRFIVVGNLSYGGVALSPITEERNGDTYIVGTDIPVWYTKVGSTEAHNDEFVLVDNLFTSSQLRLLAEENPLIAVVDGSTSVSDPTRTSAHIPDGFKGYRNYFIVLNYALYGSVNPADFYEDTNFVRGLLETPQAKQLIQMIKSMSIAPRAPGAYKFRFWYDRKKGPTADKDEFLYLRVGKQKDTPAPKVDISGIDSPTCIFIQSAIHPDDVDSRIQGEFIGGRHTPAFFDDREHFKKFYLDYEEGYGVVLSKQYAYLARKIFGEFMRYMGEEVSVKPATAGKIRKVSAIVLDLDDTLVKTDTDLDISTAGTINELLSQGRKVVIITEDIEENVDRRLRGVNKGANLVIFSDGGTKGYTFNQEGTKVYYEDYNAKSRISNDMRQRILGLIEERTYTLDDRAHRISPDYRIDLRNVWGRDRFIDRLQDILGREGIRAKVYKAGKTSVKVVLQHKEHAVRYIIERSGIDESKTLIVGDSARSRGIDRGLLTAARNSISVNVGSYSPTIHRENPNIVQFDRGGIETTLRLLSNIITNGGLPEHMIVPSSRGQPAGEEEPTPELRRSVNQMGKRAEVEEIIVNEKDEPVGFRVKGREEPISLNRQDIDLDKIPQVQDLISAIVSLFRLEDVPVYTFRELINDLFGFASAEKKIIALHESLGNDPVALFHEIGHYLISSGKMELLLESDELLIKISGREYRIRLDAKPLAIANKDRNNPHYLLRALQRQVFKEKDRDLTIIIKAKQLLSLAIKAGEKKGIPPGEIRSVFDLFKQGIDILTMDPDLDPGQIDGSYFTLMEQISELVEIDVAYVRNAFTNQKFNISQGKIIKGTKLFKAARRLGIYNKIYSDTRALVRKIPDSAVEESDKSVVVFRVDMFGDMSLVGLKTVLNNLPRGDVKLGLRVPVELRRKAEEFVETDWELRDRVILLSDRIETADNELKQMNYENISFVDNVGAEAPPGVKIFGFEEGSSFYAVFLFGAVYARSDRVDELIAFLTALGIHEPEKVIEKMNKREFFTVRLVRVSEIIEEFKNRRIYIDIAA